MSCIFSQGFADRDARVTGSGTHLYLTANGRKAASCSVIAERGVTNLIRVSKWNRSRTKRWRFGRYVQVHIRWAASSDDR